MIDSTIQVSLQTLRDLLIEEAKFMYGVSSQVEEVQRELNTIRCFLIDADKWSERYDPAILRDWIFNLKDLASKAENALEKYAVEVMSKRGGNLMKKLERFSCILNECLSVHQVGEDIKAIRSRLTDLTIRLGYMSRGERSSSAADDQQHLMRLTYGHVVDDHFVGMEVNIDRLVPLVMDDKRSNRVISICGMGGLGKTTLARKIYQYNVVQGGFEALAWVCISQQFQAKNVLRQILKQFLPERRKEEIGNMEQCELVEELHNFQKKKKKCFVVLDDIWETHHWHILKPAFPIIDGYCKVLLTTRNEKIDSEECLYKLDFLTEDQGWELLGKMALSTDYSPVLKTELRPLADMGRKIVQKCGRLPLAISIVGGILRQRQTLGEWEKVYENMDSYLKHGEGVGNDKRVEQVLDMSYNVLPYYLKSCFLYLGSFPKGEEIDTERLYLLWMAEGLISSEGKGRKETLRDVGERYLSELAFRCMVQVQKDEFSSPYNKLKSCRLHNLMHDLCVLKGEEKGFIKIFKFCKQTNYVPSVGAINRLAIHFDGATVDYLNEQGTLGGLRSLLLLHKESSIESTVLSKGNLINLKKLKFLRILVLENCKFERGKLPSEVGKLIHLRCLSLFNSNVDELPLFVCDLPYLQTLDLRVWGFIRLPNAIFKMKRLRHLFLDSICITGECGDELTFDGLKELEILQGFNSRWICSADIPTLTNLQYLSAVVYDSDSLSTLVHHTSKDHSQLRETRLDIMFCDFISEEGSNIFKKMLMSRSLISLRVEGRIGCSLPCYQPELCINLVELSLHNAEIEGDAMEVLGKFPMLKSLYLYGEVLCNPEMIFRAASFPQLKYLSLLWLSNLEKWLVDRGAMPNLSRLYINYCTKLEMIPDELRFITTLHELSTIAMPSEFNDRLRVVNGEQGQDYHKVCHVRSISLEDLEILIN